MKPSNPTRKSPNRWLLVLATTIAISTSACGSSADTSASSDLASIDEPSDSSASGDTSEGDSEDAESTEAVDPDQAFAEFEACMAEYGVAIAIGGSGGAAVDAIKPDSDPSEAPTEEDLEAAGIACDPILEKAFGSFDASPEQEAEQADELLEMQQCLAEAGFEIDLSGGSFELSGDIDFDEFNVAMDNCAPASTLDGEQQP